MSEFDCADDAAVATARGAWQPGDVVLLYPGTTYVPFTLPAVANGDAVTIKAKATSFTNGTRVGAGTSLPRISFTGAHPDAVSTLATGTYAFQGIEFYSGYASDPGNKTMLAFDGSAATAVADLPANASLRHCRFIGSTYQRRALALNCYGAVVHDSIFENMAYSNESTAIGTWNAAGTLDIYNNYFDRCGVGLLTGGAAIALPETTRPPAVVFERNHLYWPTSWSNLSGVGAKAHVEFKHWYSARLIGNIFDGWWPVGQTYMINFSDYAEDEGYRSEYGRDITMALNIFKRTTSIVKVLEGTTTVPNRRQGFYFMHNAGTVGWNVKTDALGGVVLIMPFQVHDQVIDHNTILAEGSNVYGTYRGYIEQGTPLRITDNIMACADDGFFTSCEGGRNHQDGLTDIAGATHWECSGNICGGDAYTASYPETNDWLTSNDVLKSAILSDYRPDPAGDLAGTVKGVNPVWLQEATENVEAGTVGTTRITRDQWLIRQWSHVGPGVF